MLAGSVAVAVVSVAHWKPGSWQDAHAGGELFAQPIPYTCGTIIDPLKHVLVALEWALFENAVGDGRLQLRQQRERVLQLSPRQVVDVDPIRSSCPRHFVALLVYGRSAASGKSQFIPYYLASATGKSPLDSLKSHSITAVGWSGHSSATMNLNVEQNGYCHSRGFVALHRPASGADNGA